MPEKKPTNSSPIPDSEILALYGAVIPLLSNNPEGLNITSEINKRLLAFVTYDSYHYIMEAPSNDPFHGPLDMSFESWKNLGPPTNAPSVSMHTSNPDSAKDTFEESIEHNYQSALSRQQARHPEIREYDYYRIESKTHPRIMLGFFRRASNPFTHVEKNLFDQLTPHLISLYRAVLNQVSLSQSFQYFNSFAKLGSKLATDYSLSESEVRLIPDILFGYSSEEIAERNFISPATVKTHVNHILKKTGTKSRLDFIGKFFTSPDHVQL